MRYRTWILGVLAAAMLGVSLPAVAQDTKIVKKGNGLVEVTVLGQGTSEEDAISDAKRKAVEAGSGTLVYSESKTKDFVLIKDTVLTRATGFVQEFRQISKNTTEDGIVEIKAAVVVSVNGIEDRWGTVTNLLQQVGRPKIMVYVNERIANGAPLDVSTVQTRIERELLQSGFMLVDRNQIKSNQQKELQLAIANDDPAKIQAIAKSYGAQIFITGTATAFGGPKELAGMRVFAYEAEANIRTFRTDTAQMLSAVPGKSTRGVQRVAQSAAKQALDNQGEQIAPKIRADILQFWMDAVQGRGEVVLEIRDVGFREYVTIKKEMAKLKEAKSFNTEYANKIATVSIQSEVRAEKLAEKIIELFENVEITDISQNTIKAVYKSQ